MGLLGRIFGKKEVWREELATLKAKIYRLERELRMLKITEPPKPIFVQGKNLEEVLLTEFDPIWPQLRDELLMVAQDRWRLPRDQCVISERGIVARAKIFPKKRETEFLAGEEFILVRGAKIFRVEKEGYCDFLRGPGRVAHFHVDSRGVTVFPSPVLIHEEEYFGLWGDGEVRADIGLIGVKMTRRGMVVA